MKKYLYNIKKYIAAQIMWDLFGVLCLAVAPLLQEWIFDYGLEHSLQEILAVIAAYFLLLIFYSVSQFFCALFSFKGGILFEKNLKKDFFRTVFHMDSSKFYKKSIGEYISLQGNDITALEQDYLQPIISIIRSVNMMIVYGLVLFLGIDWRIALMILLTSILAIAIPKLMGGKLTKTRTAYQKQMGKYVTVITDLLEGFHIINRMTVDNINRRHELCLEETAKKRFCYGKRKSIVLCFSELFTKLIQIVTFAAIAILFFRREITVGVGVATLSYVMAFVEPIDTILYDITTMQSMKEVKDKVLSYVQKDYVDRRIRKQHLVSGITFGNVNYTKGDFGLKGINLHIEKGKKYAVTGASGAGKSTLLKLIMGYEKPDSGTIEIDGKDINEMELSELVSYIDQNEHIYRAGLWDNITVFQSYPRKNTSDVLKYYITDFFSALLSREKEENCQCFSGGERQAIAFMRMMAKGSELILMDEPFSAIDAENRSFLQDYLLNSKEFQEKTVLMVTHNIEKSDLSAFDKVICVDSSGVYVK